MSFWLTSVAVPIGVSGATSVVAQLTFGPRLAARSAYIEALHARRIQLADDLLQVMIVCAVLESADPSKPGMGSECARWEAQLDELITRLADNGPVVALSHVNVGGIPELLTRCLGVAHRAWLSGKPLQERIEELKEAAGPVQQFYGRRWWHRPQSITQMRAVVAKYRTPELRGTS